MRLHYAKAIITAVLFTSVIASQLVLAQEGNPYLTHFKLPTGISNQNWGFVQGENGLMYILNRKGVYSFDGLQWENLGITGRPIAVAFSNKLFFCTDKGVGFLDRSQDGELNQQLILETGGNNFFYKFNRIPNGLLVVSPLTICRIHTEGRVEVDTLYHESRPEVFISDFFQLNGEMYHVKNRALIYLNKSEGNYEMLAGLPIGEDMTFSFIHANHAYFGSTNNKLYRFDGERLTPVELKDQKYLNASMLNGGKSVNDSLFALSTLNGGLLLVNSKDGSTQNTINFFNGLPDDEVLSMEMDKDGGLWISHGMGITRADLKLPIKSMGYYPGLKGTILSCIKFKENLYVGCSEGLFLLAETRDYRVREVIVASKTTPKSSINNQKVSVQQQTGQTIEEKKKNFISRLFYRQSDELDSENADERAKVSVSVAPKESELPPQKRRIYELQAISHSYKQVMGVRGKVRALIVHDGVLLAATNFGLYEVNNEKATQIYHNLNITFIETDRYNNSQLLIGTDSGALFARKKGSSWNRTNLLAVENQQVVSMVGIDNDNFVISTEFDVMLVTKKGQDKPQVNVITSQGTEYGSPIVRRVEGTIKVFTSNLIFDFNPDNCELVVDDTYQLDQNSGVYFSQEGITWINQKNVWSCLRADERECLLSSNYLSLFDNPNFINVDENGEMLVVNSYNQLFRIPEGQDQASERTISLFLKDVSGRSGVRLNPQNIELDYSNNSLVVTLSAPSFLKEGSTLYQYKISGLTDRWSATTGNPVFEFPYFPPGNYTISVRACDVLGNSSEALSLSFEIKPPFWKTLWFYGVCAVIIILVFVLIVKIREKKLKREKEILEQKVKERTKTIEEQKEVLKKQRDDLVRYNEEILQQKEEIEAQRDEIGKQRDQIFKQNDEITKSITYARRIQSAVMPSNTIIKNLMGNYFLLFRPRDIVSGDFYWMSERDGIVLVAASDCTGHGVPGAFMSMMGISFLNDIVNVGGLTQPDLILNELRQKIKANFRQTADETETRDGMDIALCAFNTQKRRVQFAGAYNPMYLVRKGQLTEFKGDKMPVGAHLKEVKFSLHEIDIEPGDNIYIFSDGYVDQFGGDKGKKFMAKPFKDLIMSVHGKPMPEQQQVLEDTLDKWQAALDQIDDILVFGIQID